MNAVPVLEDVKVRLATPSDAEMVSGLLLKAFLPFKAEYTDGAFEYTTATADVISGRFSEGPIWLAERDGVAIGTVSGLPEADRFYIRSMAIDPLEQKSGIGQKLLETLENHAREKGFDRLYLYTTFVLAGARRLYEKNGFYVVRETLPDEWFGMGGLEMEKNLG